MKPRFLPPVPGSSLHVVERWRGSTGKLVPIVKIAKKYVHLASIKVPLEDLLVHGFHRGDNHCYWLSESVHATSVANKRLLTELSAQIQTLQPQHLDPEAIRAAAAALGLDLSPKS